MISLSETYSPSSSAKYSSIVNFFLAILRSFSQLFFSTKPYVGLVFLCFTSYLSIQATAYAVLGACIAYVTSYLLYKDSEHIRQSGGVGYNCCIIGFFLTEFIAQYQAFGVLTLFCACIISVILNRYLHIVLYRLGGFPALSASAFITIAITYLSFSSFIDLDIRSSFSNVYIEEYYYMFYIGYLAMYTLVDMTNARIAIIATAPVLFFSILYQQNLSYLIINLSIAAFAPSHYFAKDTAIGLRSSMISIACCVPVFFLGQQVSVPFLLLPAIIGIWAGLFVNFGRYYHLPMTQDTKTLADILTNAKENKLTVSCLSGAGISTNSGIPDYTSQVWIEKDVPAYYYNFDSFLKSRTARKIYYTSCHKFMRFLDKARPSSIHKILMSLQKDGYLKTMITQNVDGLLQKAGCDDVLEIHGKMDSLNCLKCGSKYNWPDDKLWERQDLICESCDGFIKPSVKAYGEPLDYQCWNKACEAASKSDVLLVLGTRMFVGSASHLLEIARNNNAAIVFVNDSWVAAEKKPDDIIIYGKLENILPTIKALL